MGANREKLTNTPFLAQLKVYRNCCVGLCCTIRPPERSWSPDCFLPMSLFFLHLHNSKKKKRKKKKPCYNPILVGRIFSVVEPTIWHLGDSPKYEWPIHGAQWSRLAMALLPLPPSILKTIFGAAVLALFPEINKRGTRSCPWNPQRIKPLWDASTWHKQSDLTTMGKSYSALWDLGDTIALPFQSTH